MRFATKELVGMTVLLVLIFLILTHATGFGTAVSALGKNYSGVVKTLQGR